MKLTICGHRDAAKLLEKNPNQLDVIFISNPDDKFGVEGSEKIAGLAKELCEVLFFDVTFALGHSNKPPELAHVKKSLKFAKDKDELIVTCQYGQSRSSAIAYLIEASLVGYKEAFKILNPKVHSPNALVIKHGVEILGEPNMLTEMLKWKMAAEEMQWESDDALNIQMGH